MTKHNIQFLPWEKQLQTQRPLNIALNIENTQPHNYHMVGNLNASDHFSADYVLWSHYSKSHLQTIFVL